MPDYTIRGTITYPFTASITTDSADGFDLAEFYGAPRNAITLWALDEDGPLSEAGQRLTVHDTEGDYTIDTIEEA